MKLFGGGVADAEGGAFVNRMPPPPKKRSKHAGQIISLHFSSHASFSHADTPRQSSKPLPGLSPYLPPSTFHLASPKTYEAFLPIYARLPLIKLRFSRDDRRRSNNPLLRAATESCC